MKSLSLRIHEAGPLGFSLFALAAVVVTLFVVYTKLPQHIPVVDIPAPQEKIVIPSSGVEGFRVEEFCEDSATKVQALPAPDAINNVTYQLTRVSPTGVFETVVVPGSLASATHYYDASNEQQSEPGFLSDDARACVLRKAK